MAKKNKSSSSRGPNAPEFRILQQPAHNPYYPDPSATTLLSSAPPPYSDLTVPISSAGHYHNALPMSQINSSSTIHYPRINENSAGYVPITIQNSGSQCDRRAERRSRKVRSFNNQALLIGCLAMILSIWAYNLYEDRTCIYNFTVDKPGKDLIITIRNVREMHIGVASLSAAMVLICLLKSACGFKSESHSCYLLIVALCSLITTAFTGYLAYLAFYSPCALRPSELLTNASKTILGSFVDKLPSPDKGMLGEQNVFAFAQDDRYGVRIFLLDVFNFVLYASVFLSAAVMC